MIDRFKFRVWNNKMQKFHIVFSMHGIVNDTLEGYAKDENFVLEQCTGLKDKNGKLIYEGDLIKEIANKYSLEVFYENGAWQTREYRENGKREQLLYVLINCYGVEVIGNIHENPELLEVQDDILRLED